MDEKQKQIDDLKQKIQTAKRDLEAAKRALFELAGEGEAISSAGSRVSLDSMADIVNGEVIEGDFNGENMVGPNGKIYPVPANYASKSKLVEGDRLKLTIIDDGTFLFKQIQPAAREKVIAELGFSDNAYHATYNNNDYNILYASVTYHKAKPGDKVAIIIPSVGSSKWAAFDNVIHNIEEEKTFLDHHQEGGVGTKADVETIQSKIISDQKPTVDSMAERVVKPLNDNIESEVVQIPETLTPEKPSILSVGDIKIEAPKAAAPLAAQVDIPEQPPIPAQVHSLDDVVKSAEQKPKEVVTPVLEMEI